MSGDNDRVEDEGAGEDFMVTLKCDADERSLQANKTVMAKHSKYFEGLVSFDERELIFDSKIVRFEALEKLIKFMDSGEFNFTMNDLEALFYAADYLQIETALAQLVAFLYADLAEQMKDVEKMFKSRLLIFIRIYPIVRRYEVKHNYAHKDIELLHVPRDRYETVKVAVAIVSPLAIHFKRIQNVLSFLEMDADHVLEILDSNFLRITESEVLGAIKRWIYFDMPVRKTYWTTLLRLFATMLQ